MQMSPYDSDSCHLPPLVVWSFDFILKHCPGSLIISLFTLMDVIASYALSYAASSIIENMIKAQDINGKNYAITGIDCLLLKRQNTNRLSRMVRLCYLYSPYVILCCVGRTITVLNNLLIALTLFFMASGRAKSSMFFLAISSYLDLYPCVLIVPLCLYANQQGDFGTKFWARFLRHSLFFAFVWLALIFVSFFIANSWQFMGNTYGFIVTVPDLTPNVGLFWYFFTETFDHFRLFFLWIFILNPLIYVAPLSIRLRNEPALLCYIFLMLICVFKSYPSVGDAALYLSLLPIWSHLFRYARHGLLVVCCLLTCTVLGPVMWHMWIESGSANSNFYFAITLVYSTAQIFLLTDILHAHLRRNFHLSHGTSPMLNGEEAKVVLK